MLGLAITLDVENEDCGDGLTDRCARNGLLIASQSGDVLLFPCRTSIVRTASRGMNILAKSA